MLSGIYIILNQINGKRYVGSASHYRKRATKHFSGLRNGNHFNVKLQRAVEKYGVEYFAFLPIHPIDTNDISLIELENEYIRLFSSIDNGYNITTATVGGGVKISTHPNRAAISKPTKAGGGRSYPGTKNYT